MARPPKASVAALGTATEREFMAAVDRLEKGKPHNPKLKQAAARQKLRINFTTVAQEAGRSRTLIGHDKCEYLAVRQRIKQHMDPSRGDPRSSNQVIKRLRKTIVDLELQLKNAQTEILSHFNLRTDAEKARDLWKKKYMDLRKNTGSPVVHLAQDR